MSVATTSTPIKTGLEKPRRSIAALLAPLDQLATSSPNIVAQPRPTFEAAGEHYELPRYLFIGPQGGDSPISIGIFAAIHGDEPEGAYALVQFLQLLEERPELATGYYLSVYPVCNPTGFEDNTRHSRRGHDLNREFWKHSAAPEVRLLQAELVSHSFHGIISLHTHDTSEGFYGIVRGATLTKHLIEPALLAAESFLPRDERLFVEGVPARNGVIRGAGEGVFSAPPKVRVRPFEIVLEGPKAPPTYAKTGAFIAALQTILTEYRKLMAYAPNI